MRDALYSLALRQHETCGGRLVRKQNIHLTLVFLGAVAAGRIPEIMEVASSIRASGFAMEIDKVGYWRRSRIVWVAPGIAPPDLIFLVDALMERLRGVRGVSLAASEDRSFKPHVSLLRDAVRRSGVSAVKAGWQVRDYALIESVPGANGPDYQILARWPLPVTK